MRVCEDRASQYLSEERGPDAQGCGRVGEANDVGKGIVRQGGR